jgi:microcystin-dependent protein
MSEPFVAEIRIFGFNFAPKGWGLCAGQLLPISQNTALFSLIGTYYGGDGKSTFALPNLQGIVPIGQGQGAGLSNRVIGEVDGTPNVTLALNQMPAHTHRPVVNNQIADDYGPTNDYWAPDAGGTNQYGLPTAAPVQMAPIALNLAGGSQPHNNMQPYVTMNYCIALQGIYPPRS